jgi:predicted SPOUT superfamily RNA methylase MTH1
LEDGTYWGYTTRLASSIQKVLEECPYSSGYDLKIGTSERGSQTVESKTYSIPAYQHAIIVFGGVAGIEECVDADESIMISGSKSHTMFDQWVNICPFQGSRTIRTEEAVMITLAKLGSMLSSNASNGALNTDETPSSNRRKEETNVKIDLSDDDVSEESGSEDGAEGDIASDTS